MGTQGNAGTQGNTREHRVTQVYTGEHRVMPEHIVTLGNTG